MQVYIKENGFLGIMSGVSAYCLESTFANADSMDCHATASTISHNDSKKVDSSNAQNPHEQAKDSKITKETAPCFCDEQTNKAVQGGVFREAQSSNATPESKLFITSKSDALSPYATIMRELIDSHLAHHARTIQSTKESLESTLATYLKDQNLSLVFEIIEPSKDPHIIAYSTPQVILLDAIYNTPNLAKLPYDELCALGARFGFRVKEQVGSIACWEEFMEFLRKHDQLPSDESPHAKDSRLLGSGAREDGFIEGFVLEDSAGFMLKIKLPYYQGWKHLRNLLESPSTKSRHNLIAKLKSPLTQEFAKWLESTSTEQSLIALREAVSQSTQIISLDPPR